MSGLVLNEALIDPSTIIEKTIKIERINTINSGVRLWFVILADGVYYQRWSMLMNPADEILVLAQPGDTITIKYIEDNVEDPIHQQFESFNRNIILDVIITK